MTVFYFIGIFEAFFLGLLLLFNKARNKSNSYLGIYFLIFGINILFVYLETYNLENDLTVFPFTIISPPMLLLHGPLIWFYTSSIVKLNFRMQWKHYLHFIPFFIFAPHMVLYFNNIPIEIRLEVYADESFKNWIEYKFYVFLVTISIFTYFTSSILRFRKYRLYDKKTKSAKFLNLKWINFFFIILFIIYGLTLPINVLDIFFDLVSFKDYQYYSYLFASLIIPVIGFFGHSSTDLFKKTEAIKISKSSHEKKKLKKEKEKQEFIEQLLNTLKKEKIYTQQDLSLNKLAITLNVSPDYLSETINLEFQKNFLDFINSYRIDEFKKRLKKSENKNKPIIDLAFEVGFSSKATFNRVFKNKTNMTPSEYKRQVSKN